MCSITRSDSAVYHAMSERVIWAKMTSNRWCQNETVSSASQLQMLMIIQHSRSQSHVRIRLIHCSYTQSCPWFHFHDPTHQPNDLTRHDPTHRKLKNLDPTQLNFWLYPVRVNKYDNIYNESTDNHCVISCTSTVIMSCTWTTIGHFNILVIFIKYGTFSTVDPSETNPLKTDKSPPSSTHGQLCLYTCMYHPLYCHFKANDIFDCRFS